MPQIGSAIAPQRLQARVAARPTVLKDAKVVAIAPGVIGTLVKTPKMRAAAEYRGVIRDCDQAIAQVKLAISMRQSELARQPKPLLRWPPRKDALLTELQGALTHLETAKRNAQQAIVDLFAPPRPVGKFPLEKVKLPASWALDINLNNARAALERAGKLSPPRFAPRPPHKPGTPIGPPIPPFNLNPISRAIGSAQSWVSLAKMQSDTARKILAGK